MKLKLTAAVDGLLSIPTASASIAAARPPFTFVLSSDETGRVATASVIVELTDEQSKPCKCLSADGRLDILVPPEVYEATVGQLQALESNLSFGSTAGLQRIRWDEPTLDLIPETADEVSRVNTRGFHLGRRYADAPAIVSESTFQSMILSAPEYDSLIEIKAFA